MSAEQVGDGNLPAARTRLERAISALIDPQQTFLDGQLRRGASRYMLLWDATPGEQITGRRELSATAVTWIEALRLRIEIDTRVEITQPAYCGVPPTVGRLKHVLKRTWRPQDVGYVDKMAKAVEEWCVEIDELLNPTPKWTLPAPCPACGKSRVYKRDSAGETVRQPALQIGPNGCYCANPECDGYWAPEHFVFLSKLLGTLPENVLE